MLLQLGWGLSRRSVVADAVTVLPPHSVSHAVPQTGELHVLTEFGQLCVEPNEILVLQVILSAVC